MAAKMKDSIEIWIMLRKSPKKNNRKTRRWKITEKDLEDLEDQSRGSKIHQLGNTEENKGMKLIRGYIRKISRTKGYKIPVSKCPHVPSTMNKSSTQRQIIVNF